MLVFVLWMLPVPNPVKVLAVTFHELSHATAANCHGRQRFRFRHCTQWRGCYFRHWGRLLPHSRRRLSWQCPVGRPALCCFSSIARPDLSYCLGNLCPGHGLFRLAQRFHRRIRPGLHCPHDVPLLDAGMGPAILPIRLVGSACCCYAPLEIGGELFRLGRAQDHGSSDCERCGPTFRASGSARSVNHSRPARCPVRSTLWCHPLDLPGRSKASPTV